MLPDQVPIITNMKVWWDHFRTRVAVVAVHHVWWTTTLIRWQDKVSCPPLPPINVRMYSRRTLLTSHSHTLSPCLVGGGVTRTTASIFNNNIGNNTASHSQQSSSHHHHYPKAARKSSNYAMHNYGEDPQIRNSHQHQSHRESTTNNNNFNSNMYHRQSQKQLRTSPQGPYITQVTIRDNQRVIQSPNI